MSGTSNALRESSLEPSSAHILVVDDEKDILDLICFNLRERGFTCSCVGSGAEAGRLLESGRVTMAILDIVLPDMSGLDLLKRVRFSEKMPTIPVLLLSAKGDVMDRLLGFELGADDYVVKPFSPRELVLRVKSIVSRAAPLRPVALPLEMAGMRLDSESRSVSVEGESVELTQKEFDLLHYLMANPRRVRSRDDLLREVWHYRFERESRTVDTCLHRLRQKLGGKGAFIKTVRGLGYKFDPGGKVQIK